MANLPNTFRFLYNVLIAGQKECLNIFDFFRFLLIQDNSLKINTTKKFILIAGRAPNYRVIKYANLLAKEENNLIYLCSMDFDILNQTKFSDNINLIRYRSISHLENLVKNSNAEISVAFCSRTRDAASIIKHSKSIRLLDIYDCRTNCFGEKPPLLWLKSEVKFEKYNLENADGIIARNLESKDVSRRFSFKYPSKSILFLDYCDTENFQAPSKNSLDNEKDISLVYSGGIFGPSALKSSWGIIDFDILIKSLAHSQLNLHLYPFPNEPISYYSELLEMEKTNSHLTIYPAVSNFKLASEIGKYHFGILPNFKVDGYPILDFKLDMCTSNKFFNYLEAGIPIIVSNELKFMSWIVKRYQIGIVVEKKDLNNLKTIIFEYDYEQMIKNVVAVRNKLSFQHNNHRLLAFLNHI
jgi:hypothetical protein